MPYREMMQSIQGPVNIASRPMDTFKNTPLGLAERLIVSENDFETQRRTFQRHGYALDPGSQDSSVYVGDIGKAIQYNGATVYDAIPNRERPVKRRMPKGDAANNAETYLGPWAGYEDEELPPEIEQEASEEELARLREFQQRTRDVGAVSGIHAGGEFSTFHGTEEKDYLGRTYIDIPKDVDFDLTRDPGDHDCYTPKALIHTWTGHAKGVTAVRFFPGSGHLLLSSSMDCKVKIWDVYHDRKCLRTFVGHDKPVRDICFSNDGRRFLSAGYDKFIKLWDTETGKCLNRFTNDTIPYCVKFHPADDRQNVFLAGCSDNKIVQWDTDSGDVTQEYNQHIGPVNTITFIDENRRFVSSADDKTLRVWDFDIPVTIKYFAEPYMHSMPSSVIHPSKRFVAYQSMDSRVLVYTAHDKFKPVRQKNFSGHSVSGYACQLAFSPDGKFLMSGDAQGFVYFWDWKTCKQVRKFKAHDRVAIGCDWHPQEPSRVATCSWDGTIKYWD